MFQTVYCSNCPAGGSAVENMQPAAPEPEAEAPPEGMKLDWLECDACGKWRDKMLQPADGSGYQHWQCAVGGRRCEEDCDFCHTSPCSCDKLGEGAPASPAFPAAASCFHELPLLDPRAPRHERVSRHGDSHPAPRLRPQHQMEEGL